MNIKRSTGLSTYSMAPRWGLAGCIAFAAGHGIVVAQTPQEADPTIRSLEQMINVITRRARDMATAEVAGGIGSAGTSTGRVALAHKLEGGAEMLVPASGLRRRGRDLYCQDLDNPATNNGLAQGVDYDRNKRIFGKLECSEMPRHAIRKESCCVSPVSTRRSRSEMPRASLQWAVLLDS